MVAMFRSLGAVFEEREAFLHEYQRNIANGGLFVPTRERLDLREVVEVELDLRFCDRSVTLPAEVVSAVPEGLEAAGGEPGAAVQFLVPADELRELLGGIAGVPVPPPPPEPWPGRPGRSRRAERSVARLAARVEAEGAARTGRTRDLSRSGVLVSTSGEPIPIGSEVRVTLAHPATGEQLTLNGVVARHVSDDEGRVVCLGIAFDLDDDGTRVRLLDDLRAAAHARELAAIRGPVETLSLAGLIQMFSSCTDGGTLTVTRGDAEGRIVFEAGALRHAWVAGAQGAKALSRLVGWEDGVFSFAPVVDPADPLGDPVPIYGAILEAVHQLDELRRLPLDGLPRSARLVRTDAPEAGDLDKLEDRVLDLAAAGASVGAVVDAIADFDALVYRALLSLLEGGLLRVEPA